MKRLTQLGLILLNILAVSPLSAATLSPVETKVQQHIIQQQPQAMRFLMDLVNINSGTENIAGVRQVGDLLAKQLQTLGFATHWVEEPPSMHRAGTLIASRTGTQGQRLLLIGHLDTVFSKQSPFQKFNRQAHYVTGPGVSDDKGGDTVMLYALKALAEEKLLDNTDITIVTPVRRFLGLEKRELMPVTY